MGWDPANKNDQKSCGMIFIASEGKYTSPTDPMGVEASTKWAFTSSDK